MAVARARTENMALEAWTRLLRGHAATVRTLNAELVREHGLTINDYEALLVLANADEGRMRRVDLAQSLQLTASGVTRLLDGLEVAGLVDRAMCSVDGRVTYAVLTEAGRAKLEEASRSHVAAIEQLFAARYSERELETLGDLLSRLPQTTGPSCAVPD